MLQKLFMLLAVSAACLLWSGGAYAQFHQSDIVAENRISVGDWTGPELEMVYVPPDSISYGDLKLLFTATDDHSVISRFEYALYSHDIGDDDSDWISRGSSIGCIDESCDAPREDGEVFLPLKTIENSAHKLCSEDERWCGDKPLPEGEYYVLISCYDESSTIAEAGNKSNEIIFRFEKKNAKVICNIKNIRGRAGEDIAFPDISCEGEPILRKIEWNIDAEADTEFSGAELTGEEPTLFNGYDAPGTYHAVVRAINKVGDSKTVSFIIDIANPTLRKNDLVVNEFLPDPGGDDDAPGPLGEWIELYNKLNISVDLAGFVLYDALDEHDLPVTKENISGQNTLIGPSEYRIVYRNGNSRFSLNNSGPDRVRLFDGFIESGGLLLNECSYSESASSGESLARFPDASGELKESVPSPNSENR